jgi:hypothetical protein
MAANDAVTRAIDEAFEDHMKVLFNTMAKHFAGGHVDMGRSQFRKDLPVALQVRSEMRAIAEEVADARDVSSN